MGLRAKLTLLLAVVALTPILALTIIQYRSTRELATDLEAAGHAALVDSLSQVLAREIAVQAGEIERKAQATQAALRLQVFEVERRLAEPAPPPVPLYFVEQFDDPARWPPGTRHAALGDGGAERAQSLEVQSVMLERGVAPAAVADDLARLSAMTPIARRIFMDGGIFLSQFTALANGVRVVFPGHGGYPAGYDSTARPWYREARASDRPVWSPPIYSAATGLMTVVAAAPVHRPDGAFAGVTAIEVPVVNLLPAPRRLAPEGLPEAARTGRGALDRMVERLDDMLVIGEAAQAGTPAGLRVLARQEYRDRNQPWNAGVRLDRLDMADSDAFRGVVYDILARRGGVQVLPDRGGESIWAYAPVTAFSGALLLVLPFDRVLNEASQLTASMQRQASVELTRSGWLSATFLALVGALAWWAAARASRPIRQLAATAARIGDGELEARAPAGGSDEIGRLADSFNAMIPRLKDAMRMRQGLELAHEVQASLLPSTPPRLPGFDIAGVSEACDETGGDYYDFLDLSSGEHVRLAAMVGDVSGHGIAAALLMASARALVRASVDHERRPAVALDQANRLLAADLKDGSFMTLVLLIVDAGANTITCVNAGHDAPAVLVPDEDRFLAFAATDVPLGLEPGWRFHAQQVALPAGPVVIALGTDGIWETLDPAGNEFGRARFEALLKRHATLPAAEICARILAAVTAFRGSTRVRDDVTLAIIKRAGAMPGRPDAEG